jgi:hypothetical protein
MAGQLQFDFPNFELWHAGTAYDHVGAIASQRFRFFVSRLNNLAFCATERISTFFVSTLASGVRCFQARD